MHEWLLGVQVGLADLYLCLTQQPALNTNQVTQAPQQWVTQ